MFLLLTILFSQSLSIVVCQCPEGWVDASEFDLGKRELKVLYFPLHFASISSRMPPPVQQGPEPQPAHLGQVQRVLHRAGQQHQVGRGLHSGAEGRPHTDSQ